MGLKTEKITIEIDIIPVERYVDPVHKGDFCRQLAIRGTNYKGVHYYFINDKGKMEYERTAIFGITIQAPIK